MHLSPYERWKLNGNIGSFSDFYVQWRNKKNIDKNKDKLIKIDETEDTSKLEEWTEAYED